MKCIATPNESAAQRPPRCKIAGLGPQALAQPPAAGRCSRELDAGIARPSPSDLQSYFDHRDHAHAAPRTIGRITKSTIVDM